MRSRAGLVVAFLVALMLPASFSNAHGNSDLLLPSQGHGDDKVVRAAGDDAKPWPCCDFCVCTKSIPPQCRCSDVLIGGCDSNCKKCFCTKSIPPQCQCRDVIYDYCGDSCTDP